MISNRIKTYLFLISILLLGGYSNILLAQPTATIVSPDTAFCVVAPSVNLVIKFTGNPPFGFIYTDGIGGTLFNNRAVDGVFSYTDTIVKFNISATHKYKVIEVFDNTIPQQTVGGEVKWVEGTGSKLCYGDLDIRIDKMPYPNAGKDTAVCDYFSVLKGKSSITNSQLTWSSTSTGVTFDNANSATPKVTVPLQGDYIFKLNEVNLKCSHDTMVSYRFYGFAEATLSGLSEVCGSGNIATSLVTDKASYPITYTYKDITGSNPSTAIEVYDSPFNSTIAAVGDQTFKLNSVVDKNGCITPSANFLGEAKSIDVKPKPIMPSNQVVCSDFATVTVQSDLGSGTWSGLGTFENSNATSTKYTKPSGEWGNDTIFWTEVYGGFCSTKDTAFIEFQKTPISDAGLDSILFLDTELKLQANLPEYGFGTWSSSNESVKFDDASIHDTYVRSLPYEKVCLTWTVENGICPSTSDYVDILVKGFTYANGFTPNGDGINDYFEIFGLMQRPILNNELKVFDAVGRVVYSAKDYKNNWDGTDLSGNPLPTGAYYYQFTGDGIEAVQTYLIIKRE